MVFIGLSRTLASGCRTAPTTDTLRTSLHHPQPLDLDDPMDLPFHTLDVFTDRTFGGNPLGVFPDATHLSTELMQRIALEMNLSETVFLGPAETPDGSARVRIFTPGREVPFAGHPTVGSAIFLATEAFAAGTLGDALDASGAGETTLVLEENVGPVPVVVRFEAGRPVFARFTTALLPEHRPSPHEAGELAMMIGLTEADIGGVGPRGNPLAPEMVSCGLEYFVIPVRTLDAVRRSVLDTARWQRMLANAWAHHVYIVCMEGEGPDVDVHVRMFAPGSGVPEDPATGSAAAALGGYLSNVDGSQEAALSWTVEQGIEIGRPSLLYVEADRAGGDTSAVRVGGSAVAVSRGVMSAS
jgi:trans-2,3-dihydro-3-hydroxyanthranilate isomerase